MQNCTTAIFACTNWLLLKTKGHSQQRACFTLLKTIYASLSHQDRKRGVSKAAESNLR